MINHLTDSLRFQTEALVLRSERQRLIASNIANADTPGYVARDFNFAQALKQAQGHMMRLPCSIISLNLSKNIKLPKINMNSRCFTA